VDNPQAGGRSGAQESGRRERDTGRGQDGTGLLAGFFVRLGWLVGWLAGWFLMMMKSLAA